MHKQTSYLEKKTEVHFSADKLYTRKLYTLFRADKQRSKYRKIEIVDYYCGDLFSYLVEYTIIQTQ